MLPLPLYVADTTLMISAAITLISRCFYAFDATLPLTLLLHELFRYYCSFAACRRVLPFYELDEARRRAIIAARLPPVVFATIWLLFFADTPHALAMMRAMMPCQLMFAYDTPCLHYAFRRP